MTTSKNPYPLKNQVWLLGDQLGVCFMSIDPWANFFVLRVDHDPPCHVERYHYDEIQQGFACDSDRNMPIEFIADSLSQLVHSHRKREAWDPLVKEVVQRARSEDGEKDTTNVWLLALSLPPEFQPSEGDRH